MKNPAIINITWAYKKDGNPVPVQILIQENDVTFDTAINPHIPVCDLKGVPPYLEDILDVAPEKNDIKDEIEKEFPEIAEMVAL